MNPSRIWTLGAVVAVLAIGGGAVGLGVQPQLAAANTAADSTKQVQQTIDASQTELTRLARVAATQASLEKDEERLGSGVTGSLRLNTFSRQLRNVAALDGVRIIALDPGDGLQYVPAAGSAAASAPASTGTASSAPTPAPTPTATATTAPDPGQFGATNPLITEANYTVIPVAVIVTGTQAAGIAFAQDVQQMNRLFAVDTVTYSRGSGNDSVPTTTISGNIYALKG